MMIPSISEHDLIIIQEAKAIIAKLVQTGKKYVLLKMLKIILNFGLYKYEMFGVLYLNQQNQVIKFELMFRGTLNETSVYPREIAKQTLIYNAVSVILVHNHPSGECKPSQQDILLTNKLNKYWHLLMLIF